MQQSTGNTDLTAKKKKYFFWWKTSQEVEPRHAQRISSDTRNVNPLTFLKNSSERSQYGEMQGQMDMSYHRIIQRGEEQQRWSESNKGGFRACLSSSESHRTPTILGFHFKIITLHQFWK